MSIEPRAALQLLQDMAAKGRDEKGFALFAKASRELGANHILYRGRLCKGILKKANAKRLFMNRSYTVLALR